MSHHHHRRPTLILAAAAAGAVILGTAAWVPADLALPDHVRRALEGKPPTPERIAQLEGRSADEETPAPAPALEEVRQRIARLEEELGALRALEKRLADRDRGRERDEPFRSIVPDAPPPGLVVPPGKTPPPVPDSWIPFEFNGARWLLVPCEDRNQGDAAPVTIPVDTAPDAR